MFLRRRLCLLTAAVSLTALLVAAPPPAAAQSDTAKPLSLEQIKRLIQNDFPDTALAGEIRDRGIDFSDTFDRQTLETLRLLGAQEKTLRALEPYLPKAAVRIVTKLDRTTVFVDGKQYGVTDSTGVLQINDLEPGEHLIETRNRPKYKDGQLRVVLRPRDNQEVVFEPELNVGSLTITPLTPNLEVRVYNELTSLTGVFAKREMPPGVYTLQARSRWYRPVTQIIQIQSGQHLTLPIELELDETLIEDAVTEARKSFSSKDYSRSINTLLEVLAVAPRNLPALNLLAQNHLRLNDTPNFIAAAKRILDADGALEFTLLLHHEKKAPQPVRLQLSRASLTLEHLDTGETQTFPLEAFSRAFIRGDVQSEVFLVLAGARAPKRMPDLQFAMGNSYDPRNDGEGQLSQRDKINVLWNIEEILRFSLEVHREFLAVNPNREATPRPTAAAPKPTAAGSPETSAATEPRPAAPPETPAAETTAAESGKAAAKNAKKSKKSKDAKDEASQPEASSPEVASPGEDGRTAAKNARKAKKSKDKQLKSEAPQEVAVAAPPSPEPTPEPDAPRPEPGPTTTSDAASQPTPTAKKTSKKKDRKKDEREPTTTDAAERAAAPDETAPPPEAAAKKRSGKRSDAERSERTAAAAPPAPAPADEAPKNAPAPVRARALIGTMVGAVGGRANVTRIAAAQFVGMQITVEPELTTPEAAPDPKPIRQFWTRNKRLRFEVAPGGPTAQVFVRAEKTFQQRVNGRVERITQPETLKQIRMQSKLAGVGLYQQLLAPGHEVVRFSRHLADGSVEETIRVTDADGDAYDVVIDLETHRPVKCTYELPTDLGQPLQIEERYEDFRPVDNIQLPHRIVRSIRGGRTVTLTFTDIQLLPALSEELFRRP